MSSIVVLLFALFACHFAIVTPPVYTNVDFSEIVDNTIVEPNEQELAEQFSGFIGSTPIEGGSSTGDQTSPVISQETKDAFDNFVTDVDVTNAPAEITGLLTNLASFFNFGR
eukprot:TRINITY_DN500_c0_g1_i2.p4 TRINITY_DN500_c0_g1~~TRINITY_DN500_c0_g1_i2.p4  ORF type:complete len:112 (-),score=13.94 TRINITY_DN500_c0_g1_i2:825-1160(-)